MTLFLTIFGHVSAILEDFSTELERINKTKKLHMTFEDMVKLFSFMTFTPKLHILATEMEKVIKMKKLGLIDTYLVCGLRFLNFWSGSASKI